MPTSRADREAGFTLLELLVVLVILALSAAAVLQAGGSSRQSAQVRAFLVGAEALLRGARTTAIETRSPVDVTIDTEGRRLSSSAGGGSVEVPRGVTLEAKVARLEGAGLPTIRFFPSGASTGGLLAFEFRGRSYEVRVNWLTGRTDAAAL